MPSRVDGGRRPKTGSFTWDWGRTPLPTAPPSFSFVLLLVVLVLLLLLLLLLALLGMTNIMAVLRSSILPLGLETARPSSFRCHTGDGREST